MPNRRRFLQTLIGSGVALPALAFASSAAPASLTVFAPEGTTDFLEPWHRTALQWRSEPLGNTPSSAAHNLRESFSKTRPTLAVVFGDDLEGTLGTVADEFAVPLMLAEYGVRVPGVGRTSPFTVRHSLEVWRSQWALGAWSATNLGRQTALIGSVQENGYDLMFAFQSGLESAGGTVAATVLVDQAADLRDRLNGVTLDAAHVVANAADTPKLLEELKILGVSRVTVSSLALPVRPSETLRGALTAQSWDARQSPARVLGGAVAGLVADVLKGGHLEPLALVRALRENEFTDQIRLHEVRGLTGVLGVDAGQTLQGAPSHHPALLSLQAHPHRGWLNLYQSL